MKKKKVLNTSISKKTKITPEILSKNEDISSPLNANVATKAEAISWFKATYQEQTEISDGWTTSAVRALEFFEQAAAEGDADALCYLGLIHAAGSGMNFPDIPRGLALLQLSAAYGHIEAKYCLARLYENRQVKNDIKALEWLRKAAAEEHPRALFYLGLRYEEGRGVEKNEIEAVKCFRLAAGQGHRGAQFHLGVKYEDVRGVEKDEAKDLLSPRQSTKDGEEKSSMVAAALLSPRRKSRSSTVDEQLSPQRNVSTLRGEEGLSLKREHAKPSMVRNLLSPKMGKRREESGQSSNDIIMLEWLRKRAAEGHPRALYYLGLRYEEGRGVEKNEIEAVKYFRLAAEQGYSGAQFHLGEKYGEVCGVEKDEAKDLLSPRQSTKDGEEKSSMVAVALLSPRRESRSNTVDEQLSPQRNGSSPRGEEGLSLKREHAKPSMVRSLLSPKRERTREESEKPSMGGWLSPKSGKRRCDDIPHLTLGGSSSMKDSWHSVLSSQRLGDSLGSIRTKRERPIQKNSFFSHDVSDGNNTKEELSSSLQLPFELSNKK